LPSASVTVPVVLAAMVAEEMLTVTPGMGLPSLSTTCPRNVACVLLCGNESGTTARAVAKERRIRNRRLLISMTSFPDRGWPAPRNGQMGWPKAPDFSPSGCASPGHPRDRTPLFFMLS